MNAQSVIDHAPAMVPGELAVVPSRRLPSVRRKPAVRKPAVRHEPPAQPSWQQILVAAGLDRESLELSPAERWQADLRARPS